jgi:hypothetical protein
VEPGIAHLPRPMEAVVGQADENDRCLVHLERRGLLDRDQLARARQLDGATRLRLQLDCRLVGGPPDMVAMARMPAMVSLGLTIAARDDHASHRVTDMENHARRTQGCERKREK